MSVPLLSQDEFFRHLELQSVHSIKVKFAYRQALKERLRATTRKDSMSLPKASGVKRLKPTSKGSQSEKESASTPTNQQDGDSRRTVRETQTQTRGGGGARDKAPEGRVGGENEARTKRTLLRSSPKLCRRIVAKQRAISAKKQLVGKDANDKVVDGLLKVRSLVNHDCDATKTSTSMFDAAERLFRSELRVWEKKREERKRRREAGMAEFDSMFQAKKCYYQEPKREEASVDTNGEKIYCARLMLQPEASAAEHRLPAPPPPGEELARALRDAATVLPTSKARLGMIRVNYYKEQCGMRLKKSASKKRLLMSRRCKTARVESPQSSSTCLQDQAAVMEATNLADSIVSEGLRKKLSSSSLALRASPTPTVSFPPSPPPSSNSSESDQSTLSSYRPHHRRTRSHLSDTASTSSSSSSTSSKDSTSTSSSIGNRLLKRRQFQIRQREQQQQRLLQQQRKMSPTPPASTFPDLKRPILLPPDKLAVLKRATNGFSVATPAAAADLLYFHSLVLDRACNQSPDEKRSKREVCCGICAKGFPKRSKMIRHMLSVHADDCHKVDLSEFINQNSKRRAFNRLWEDDQVET